MSDNKFIKYAAGERSSERKYIRKLKKDIAKCKRKYGADVVDYFMFRFEEKSDEERSRYITDDYRHHYYPIFNKDLGIFSDKTQAYDAFRSFFMRDVLLLDTAKDKTLFYDFIKKHPDFIVKPRYGARGIGIHIVHIERVKKKQLFINSKKKCRFSWKKL